jgi:hypothetical protein
VGIHEVFDPDGAPPYGANDYRWGTPDSSVINEATERYAELVDLMNSTVDEAEIITYLHEAEQILADEAVIIPLYQRPVVYAWWPDRLGGFASNPTYVGWTSNIEEWSSTATAAEDLLEDLIAQVAALNLHNGIANSLDAKLANVVKALDDLNDSNDVAAANTLQAFINEVEAQAGGKITHTDAAELIAAAQQTISLLTT